MARFVVIGGGAAGMSAASVAERRDPSLEVDVIEKGQHISFSACGLPYWIAGTIQGDADRLVVRSPEQARERGLHVRTGTTALDIDPSGKTLTVEGADGRQTIAWDLLCLAPGLQALNPFRDLQGVYTLRHLDDGIRLNDALETSPPENACIVGGGFVGVEMAEAFCDRGWSTTLIHSHETLLNDIVDPELGRHVNRTLQEAGVDLVLGNRVEGLQGEQGVTGVDVAGDTIQADLVVLAIGAKPRTRLARAAGCRLGPADTIEVDDRMRTSIEDVYACGDAVAFPHKLTQEPVFVPLALHANRSGRVVGENVAGGADTFPGVLGTAVTRFNDLEIAATGLTHEDAQQAGYTPITETITASTRAGYFPNARDAHVRLTIDDASGQVLGGQLVGGPGTGKRVDTLAAAIWMQATAQQLEAMDLAYAPPVSPTWDPVAIAARIAEQARTR